MEQPPFRLPNKPDKGAVKEESIHMLERQEKAPLDYQKIAEEFYRAVKQRDEQEAKERMKRVQNRETFERRTLYLPETNFQNKLLALLYQRSYDRSFSFDVVKKRIKEELQKKVLENRTIDNSEREKRSQAMNIKLEKMMRGIENVVTVVHSREEMKNASDEYFIGTSDALDATRKIDLIEYAKKEGEIAIRLIQVKTRLVHHEEGFTDEDRSALKQERTDDITKEHQQYVDSLMPAIQELVHEDYDEQFKTLVGKQPILDNEELAAFQQKWNVISMAIGETKGDLRSPRMLCDYIAEHIVGYSDPVTVNDILFFKEIVTSPKLSADVSALLDKEFLPANSKEMLVEATALMEDDFEQVLEQYMKRNNVLDLKHVDFYSLTMTPDGIEKEVHLKNLMNKGAMAEALT